MSEDVQFIPPDCICYGLPRITAGFEWLSGAKLYPCRAAVCKQTLSAAMSGEPRRFERRAPEWHEGLAS